MIKINLVVVGKNKHDWLTQGVKHYQKLLKKYQVDLNFKVIKDEKIDEKKDSELVLDKEAERIFKHLSKDSYRVALDPSGSLLSSEDLANLFEDQLNQGKSGFVFIVGGASGLSEKIVKNLIQDDVHPSAFQINIVRAALSSIFHNQGGQIPQID
jgi:23S rRNA (pseudouridine1915-N3)-methyltransferase